MEEIRRRVHRALFGGQDLEMEMGPRGVARLADGSDRLSRPHLLAHPDPHGPQMRVTSEPTIRMPEEDLPPITAAKLDVRDGPVGRGHHGLPTAPGPAKVKPRVEIPPATAEGGQQDGASQRELELRHAWRRAQFRGRLMISIARGAQTTGPCQRQEKKEPSPHPRLRRSGPARGAPFTGPARICRSSP